MSEKVIVAYNVGRYLVTEEKHNINVETASRLVGSSYSGLYGGGNVAIISYADLPADFSTDTYTIENGQLVPASAEVIAERLAVKAKADALVEIAELRAYLTQTDYAAIKCGELGLSMASEYPGLHAQRTAARARINELQEGGAYAGA